MAQSCKRGLSLIEVLVAAVIAAIVMIPYLTLASGETRTTLELAQRAKAASLARNTLALFATGHRKELYDSSPSQDGRYSIENVDLNIDDSYLATGTGLSQWIGAQRRKGYFVYTVTWNPNPPNLTGISENNLFGELTCTVGWLAEKEGKKALTLKRITTR